MGDDDEIKQLIRKESESFLKHALFQARGGEGAYDFEAEFAKTRRNKSFTVLGVIAMTIICLMAVAFAVTRVIESRTAATPVSVSAFEDLNLKDLLDSSKQDESALERAKSGLVELGADLNSGLEFANRDYRASALAIRTLGLSSDEEALRIAGAAAIRDAAKAKLQAKYTAEAAASRMEIATVQKRIDRYDSRALAKAKAEQAVLENERVVFDLEKDQQARLYEARIAAIEAAGKNELRALGRQSDELAAALTSRFNPTFTDPRGASLLASRSETVGPPSAPFDPYLGSAGILDSTAEAKLDRSLSDLEYLSGRLLSTPYINSVPSALSRIAAEAKDSTGVYRGALQAAASGLAARDAAVAALGARLEKYRSALVAAARERREGGYVIDARDPARLLVVLDPSGGAREGDRGFVLREGKIVAAVSFTFEGEEAYALVTKAEEGQSPRTFDPVLLTARD